MAVEKTVFCWGQTDDGQLGLGGIEEQQIVKPVELANFQGRQQAKHVSCGQRHSVLIMWDGTVYSCGNNDYGQLGHDKPRRRPEQIHTLEAQVVTQVGCGSSHNLAINDTGQMFSWGDNTYGQLGRGYLDLVHNPTPKLVRSLSSHVVIQIACGSFHSLALTNDGLLYSWGSNSHGQLGLGQKKGNQDTPQHIKSLHGLTVKQVVAGANHSFALTVSGALFGWGKNNFGQLGVGDDKVHEYPVLCKTLRSQKIKYVAAGEEHSAALTQEGGVFTFGAGMYGQLGHNSKSTELLPKKVFELMGSVVTQIACGRCHTLAYVPSSGRIYSFGLGANGQLGVGTKTNHLSPCATKGPWVPPGGCKRILDLGQGYTTPYVVRQMYSAGDQCFVIAGTPESGIETVDFRNITDTQKSVLALRPEKIHELVSQSPKENPSAELSGDVEKIFASPGCLNSSFLEKGDDHFGCKPHKHGVDMEAARDGFKHIATIKNRIIMQLISGSLEKFLLPNLPTSPPDVEALRLYLILPWCHLFDLPHNYSNIICPFGKSIITLDRQPSKVIDYWWALLPSDHFRRIAVIFKQCVVHILHLSSPTSDFEVLVRQQSLYASMEVLKKLNAVNEQNGQIIPYEEFYIPELKDKVDIRADYINWIQPESRGGMLSFCNYPFVFDAQAKTMLLQTDAIMQMQVAVDEVHRRNLTSLFLPMVDPVNPCLVLFVSRSNIVQDTINQLSKHGSCDLKKPLKVMFVGEEAVDAGGVRKVVFLGEEAVDEGGLTKEFFMLMLREVLDPKYGMFRYFEESRLLWFSDQTFEGSSMFMLIGVLCGLAIYNSNIIDLHFPLALYRKLLGRNITIEDLKELQPSVGRSMEQLLQYEGEDVEDVFCLTFEITREVFGELRQVELVPAGGKIPVSKSNRQEYVDAYINYVFNDAVKEQFQAFYNGFHRVCGGKVLDLFHPQELQAMIVGNENYDWHELQQGAEYKGDYRESHPTIKFFWEVFHELSLQDKKKFLMFLTGSDRIPIHGMKAVKIFIQPTAGGEEFLPVAHTCFNLLDLPRYSTKERLQEKLLQAIQCTEGFGIV